MNLYKHRIKFLIKIFSRNRVIDTYIMPINKKKVEIYKLKIKFIKLLEWHSFYDEVKRISKIK